MCVLYVYCCGHAHLFGCAASAVSVTSVLMSSLRESQIPTANICFFLQCFLHVLNQTKNSSSSISRSSMLCVAKDCHSCVFARIGKGFTSNPRSLYSMQEPSSQMWKYVPHANNKLIDTKNIHCCKSQSLHMCVMLTKKYPIVDNNLVQHRSSSATIGAYDIRRICPAYATAYDICRICPWSYRHSTHRKSYLHPFKLRWENAADKVTDRGWSRGFWHCSRYKQRGWQCQWSALCSTHWRPGFRCEGGRRARNEHFGCTPTHVTNVAKQKMHGMCPSM